MAEFGTLEKQRELEAQAKSLGVDLIPAAEAGFNSVTGDDFVPEDDLTAQMTELGLGKTEQQIQKEIESLTDITTGLKGQAAFKAEKEEEFDVPEFTAAQTDLQARLKAIQAEAQAIPLQLQEESVGRGRTKAGLAPLQTARLRTNAIQALTTSALLEASRGNLVTAQDQVDRAVAAKFDPIREEIEVRKANLQLLIDSPLATAEQKKRAQEQIEAEETRKRSIAQQEADEKGILAIATKAAENGAGAETLRRLTSATSQQEALRIAAETGALVKPKTITTSITTEDKPLSINQIEQFRRSFGWTPPLGFTGTQLTQFIADNPGATPEELEAAANAVAIGGNVINTVDDTGQPVKVINTIDESGQPDTATFYQDNGGWKQLLPNGTFKKVTDSKILSQLGTSAVTPEEVITSVMDSVNKEQLKALKKKADEAGISSFFRSKRTDVKNYLNSIKDQIQEALDGGFTQEQIIEFLTQ